MLYCKDFSNQELSKFFPNRKSISFYISEIEAYAQRASIPHERVNGLCPCPFAYQELKNNRIKYEFITLINSDGEFHVTDDHVEMLFNFSNDKTKKTLVMVITNLSEIGEKPGLALAESLHNKYHEKYNIKHGSANELTVLMSNFNHVGYVNPPEFLFFLVQWAVDLEKGEVILTEAGYYDKLDENDLVLDNTEQDQHPILAVRNESGKCPMRKDVDPNIDLFAEERK